MLKIVIIFALEPIDIRDSRLIMLNEMRNQLSTRKCAYFTLLMAMGQDMSCFALGAVGRACL